MALKTTAMTSVTGKKKALTFIELLFVIIIIGILAGFALPNLRKAFNTIQLNSTSRELQSFMNYLRERAIVEGKIIYLAIDNREKKYWAQIKDTTTRLRTYPIPRDIDIETEQEEIIFYPDGQIDKVTIELISPDNQNISLTTKGVFGGVKLLTQE